MTSTKFRFLVVLSFIISMAAIACELIFQSKVPEQLHEQILSLHEQPSNLKVTIGLLAGLAATIMSMVSIIGMFTFKLWAPKVAINSTLLTVIAISFLGTGLYSAVGAALSFASTALWGSVLAMAHTPEYVRYAKSATE